MDPHASSSFTRTKSLRAPLIAGGIVVLLGLAVFVGLGIARSGSHPYSAASQGTAAGCITFTKDTTPTNVREAPTSNGRVLTTLDNGTKISVDAQDHGWSHISSPVRGWVFSDLTAVRCE